MILSTHFIAGAAAASQTDSIIWLIVSPLILHFILDSIPHWEYVDEVSELKNKIPHLIIDLAAGPAVILLATIFTYGFSIKLIFWLFAGGVIGNLPDGLSLLHIIFPTNKPLKKFFAFHEAIHHKKLLSWKIGLPVQIAIDLLAICLFILPKV